MRTAQRWSLDELDASVAAMAGAIAGADAGYSCFLVGGGTTVEVPGWVKGGTGSVMAIAGKASFGASGFKVADVMDQGRSVVIEDEGELDKMSLMSALGGITVFAEADQIVRVLEKSGRVLLDVEVAAFRHASDAREEFRDLAILMPFYNNAVRTGGEPQKSLEEWVTVMVNQVITTAPVDVGPAAMLAVADRLGYVLDFVRGQTDDVSEDLRELMKGVGRSRALAFATAQGESEAASRFAQELLGLNERVGDSGVIWPLRF